MSYDASEQDLLLDVFKAMFRAATKDGGVKRAAGLKPPWWRDPDHEAAIYSHLNKWKHGEKVDKDSGAHPLVHLAWRAMAIAYQETYGKVDPAPGYMQRLLGLTPRPMLASEWLEKAEAALATKVYPAFPDGEAEATRVLVGGDSCARWRRGGRGGRVEGSPVYAAVPVGEAEALCPEDIVVRYEDGSYSRELQPCGQKLPCRDHAPVVVGSRTGE